MRFPDRLTVALAAATTAVLVAGQTTFALATRDAAAGTTVVSESFSLQVDEQHEVILPRALRDLHVLVLGPDTNKEVSFAGWCRGQLEPVALETRTESFETRLECPDEIVVVFSNRAGDGLPRRLILCSSHVLSKPGREACMARMSQGAFRASLMASRG
jgi:hypothetical protein